MRRKWLPSPPPRQRPPRIAERYRRCKLSSPGKKDERYLLVGQVVKPHGVRGELGILSLTERPELRFTAGAELMLGADENSLRQVKVTQARPHKKGFLLRLDCVTDCEGADKIRGWGLYIRAVDAAEPLEKDSYYHHQLIGMVVLDGKLGELGRVVALAQTSANDLLEIARPGKPSFYLPLIGQFVRKVDLEAGEIETEVPAGLMET